MSSRKLRHRSHHGEKTEPAPDRHEEIEALAYELWEERGSPFGSPEEDWFAAEQQFEKDEELAARL